MKEESFDERFYDFEEGTHNIDLKKEHFELLREEALKKINLSNSFFIVAHIKGQGIVSGGALTEDNLEDICNGMKLATESILDKRIE